MLNKIKPSCIYIFHPNDSIDIVTMQLAPYVFFLSYLYNCAFYLFNLLFGKF